jgi:anti-sigma factor RsiW
VERDDIHALTAAYALDALDAHDEAAYEAHLAQCDDCRVELASLQAAAGSLAYGAPAAVPPENLRARILDSVRSERATVVPIRRRRVFQAALVAAAASLALAVGFGAWAASLHSNLSDERQARAQSDNAAQLLSQPNAEHHTVAGGDGVLVIQPNGEASLVMRDLPQAPDGQAYEAWVIQDGNALPAGVFTAGDDVTVATLAEPVPPGAEVGITLEPAGGSQTPSGPLLMTASTV